MYNNFAVLMSVVIYFLVNLESSSMWMLINFKVHILGLMGYILYVYSKEYIVFY